MADPMHLEQAQALLRRHERHRHGWRVRRYGHWRRHVYPRMTGREAPAQGWVFAIAGVRSNAVSLVARNGVVGTVILTVETVDEGFERLLRGDPVTPTRRRAGG